LDAPVYLLVALGNPGPEYQFNRHNAGFMVGEELRRRHGFPTLRSKFRGLTAEGHISGLRAVLLLPTTFMNLSGRAAAEAARFYKVPVDTMLVIHDEVELPFGRETLELRAERRKTVSTA
jgi:PTH1 family peptidyl-tRNA hydrolase